MYADRWDNFNGDSTLGSAPVASSAAATSVSFNVFFYVINSSCVCEREGGQKEREREREREMREKKIEGVHFNFVFAGVFFYCYASFHWNDRLFFCGTNRPQMVDTQ